MSSILSLTTILWLCGAMFVTMVVALMVARNARPVSSIAKVLYDVEHPEPRQ